MTKEQLKAYRALRLEHDRLDAMLDELEGVMYAPRTQRLDGQPSGGAGTDSEVERATEQHDELLERYRQKVRELRAALTEIEEGIKVLEPRERTLIRLHYIQGLTWEQVCVAMNYSWRQVHRIHSSALETLKYQNASE